MKAYLLIFFGLGISILFMAWMPTVSKRIKISYPIFLILIGALLYKLGLPLLWPEPFWPDKWLMHISEIVVIISLMGAGLKIGRHYDWKHWKTPLRLVALTMPLCMLAIFFLGNNFLLIGIPSSLLLAAVLAPTDPVLAAEVQLESPEEQTKEHNELAFSLTAEAGLNDGLAFPFTILAVMVVQAGAWGAVDFNNWIFDKLLLKIIIGIAMGIIIGALLRRMIKYLNGLSESRNVFGYIALAATFMTYGLTEICHGYGFLAVFFVGLAIRHKEEGSHENIVSLHTFTEEIEHLFITVWLILFGGSLMSGLLNFSNWKDVAAAAIIVLLVRPVIGYISLLGIRMNVKRRMVLAFFGIRGVGSIFYLSWAMIEADFGYKQKLYVVVACVILFSIIVHGITAPRIKQFLGKD